MYVKDIILDTDGKLLIKNGDFVINYSDAQHMKALLNDSPGEFKQFPNIGLNLKTYAGGPLQITEVTRDVKMALTSDGYSANPLVIYDYSTGMLNIDTKATRIR